MEAHVEEQEIDFQQAVDEEAANDPLKPRPGPPMPSQAPQGNDQVADIQQRAQEAPPAQGAAPDAPLTDAERQAQQVQEDTEILVPKDKDKPRQWKLGPEDAQREYIQEELSVIGEIQWFALLGEFLDSAMSGDSAVSLNALLSPPQRKAGNQYSVQDFQDADTFVHALGKLVAFAPEFMEKSICIWLSVPDYEWDLVREYMKMSPSKGGMSHDMFEEIIATFIDQNYTAIDRFFRERYGRLRARYLARQKEANQSRSSKR